MTRLENWSVVYDPTDRENPYLAPECYRKHLQGEVYEHPKHENGKYVRTSRILEISLGENKAKTQSREYVLGSPDKNWIDWLEKEGLLIEDLF